MQALGEPLRRICEGFGDTFCYNYCAFWGTCDSMSFATPLKRKPLFASLEGIVHDTLYDVFFRPALGLVLESIIETSWHPFGTL